MGQTKPFWRALTAFLVLPGTAAFLIPWLIWPDGAPLRMVGLPILVIGTVLLLWCVRDFYVAGRGTLAPWAPPKHLVVVGLYRFSRNPMYVSVLLILSGWSLATDLPALWIYTACMALTFHLRVVLAEEPWLARTHGEQWTEYEASVPRWLGSRQSRSP